MVHIVSIRFRAYFLPCLLVSVWELEEQSEMVAFSTVSIQL